MLKYSSKEAEQSYLSNFSSSAVLSDPASTSNNSSSKAVLAALRALQDKIRRLEAERAQAVEESSQLKHQLKLQEIEFDHSRQKESLSSQKVLQEAKNSFEKVFTEKTDLEVRLVKLEERNKSLRDFEFLQQQLDLQIKKKVGSAKKVRSTSTDGRARPQADLTHVVQASKKLTNVAVRTSDLDQLKSMHKMYVNIARSISKKDKLSKKAAGKSSRASSPQHSHRGDGTGSIGRKKEKAKLESNATNSHNNNNASSSSNTNSTIYNPYSNNNHLIFNDSPSISQEIRIPDVRIPKAVSLDDSSALHMDYDEYLSGKDRSYANLTDYRDQTSTYNNKTTSANSRVRGAQQPVSQPARFLEQLPL
eukprot:gene31488-40892_t